MLERLDRFYTYAYLKENGLPYYIGKGEGQRAYRGTHRVPIPPRDRILILKNNLLEKDAYEHETIMITSIGRKDLGTGPLLNRTNGGDGPFKCKHPNLGNMDKLRVPKILIDHIKKLIVHYENIHQEKGELFFNEVLKIIENKLVPSNCSFVQRVPQQNKVIRQRGFQRSYPNLGNTDKLRIPYILIEHVKTLLSSYEMLYKINGKAYFEKKVLKIESSLDKLVNSFVSVEIKEEAKIEEVRIKGGRVKKYPNLGNCKPIRVPINLCDNIENIINLLDLIGGYKNSQEVDNVVNSILNQLKATYISLENNIE